MGINLLADNIESSLILRQHIFQFIQLATMRLIDDHILFLALVSTTNANKKRLIREFDAESAINLLRIIQQIYFALGFSGHCERFVQCQSQRLDFTTQILSASDRLCCDILQVGDSLQQLAAFFFGANLHIYAFRFFQRTTNGRFERLNFFGNHFT